MSIIDATDVPRVSSGGSGNHWEMDSGQGARIVSVLGERGGDLPPVDRRTLSAYYRHLSNRLCFPFRAHDPEASTLPEDELFSCLVLRLLDPQEHSSDPFQGIVCEVRKAGRLVQVPLVQLEVSQDDPNFQLIEDYWYWFWNWR